MQEFDKNSFIERLITLRSRCFGERGRRGFAEALGLSASTYSYYEQDRLPPVEVFAKICQITEADPVWLLWGEKALKNSEKYSINQPVDSYKQIFERLERLSANPQNYRAVEAFLDILDGREKMKSEAALPGNVGWIPVLGRTAAGLAYDWGQADMADCEKVKNQLEKLVETHTGSKILHQQPAVVEFEPVLSTIQANLSQDLVSIIDIHIPESGDFMQFIDGSAIGDIISGCFALQIDGDSMSPRINDGDYVILSAEFPAVQGRPAVVRLSNQIGATCKIIRTIDEQIHLIPINERYEIKIVPVSSLLWALAVLGHLRIAKTA